MHQRTSAPETLLGGAKAALAFLFWASVFGVSYTQPSLYYSNQNQYFLHGLAHVGAGFLSEDWLANTADPAPVFSGLVVFTYRHLHEYFFYLYYILLFGVYFHALVSIFKSLSGGRPTALTRLAFIALVVVLHSALLRWSSCLLFGVDYPWYFQTGVAGQYILGAGLQPSVFGVLLVLSVAAFLRDRPLLAATWASLGAAMHSTYLLSAALLVLAYLYLLCREKRIRLAFFMGLWALLLVSPVLVYNLGTFAPSSREAFAEAQRLLAHFRIPHHAEIERWLDGIACVQIGGIVAATYFVRGSRLFTILFVPFVSSLLLTLVQAATRNDSLALLFPWRTSSILVPIATAVLLTRLVHALAAWFHASSPWRENVLRAACGIVLAVCVAGGALISYFHLGYRTNTQEIALLEYIRDRKASGQTYLLPVEIPKLASAKRGSVSLNFMPPPRRNEQSQFISVDLQRFRLFTGAPIYVDFKSIPYKDVEVLEWHERVQWNHRMYQNRDWNRPAIVDELARRHITHVIATSDRDIRCDALDLMHEASGYRVYSLRHTESESESTSRAKRRVNAAAPPARR